MRILNFGSLNLDYVYRVDHFVQPGETLSAQSRAVKAGGKGLNQSVALSRAGAAVCHAGCFGADGAVLKDLLEENGVDTAFLLPVPEAQGHTVIQVSPEGENCILLYGGSNRCIPEGHIRRVLGSFSRGDWLVLQNEINDLPLIVELASARGLQIVEIEAEQITGETEPEKVWETLHRQYGRLSLLLTLGKEGSVAWRMKNGKVETHREDAVSVRAVDTTAAGDTYTGYFLAGLAEGRSLQECMKRASRAAAISVTRPGAAESIPWKKELNESR